MFPKVTHSPLRLNKTVRHYETSIHRSAPIEIDSDRLRSSLFIRDRIKTATHEPRRKLASDVKLKSSSLICPQQILIESAEVQCVHETVIRLGTARTRRFLYQR